MNTLCLAQRFVDSIAFLIAAGEHPSAAPSPGEAATRGWDYLIEASFHNGSFHLTFGPMALVVGAIVFFGWLAWWCPRIGWRFGDYEVGETTLKFLEIADVKITPNHETRQIAYQAWIELSTRKIGLPFDPNQDVITEVYDSWFKAFGVIRDLAKSVPAHRIERSENTRMLVEHMIKVLNVGLRPHLTRWQAEFRRWYRREEANPANAAKSPQAIQCGFGQYAELTEDLARIQSAMIEYSNTLLDLAKGAEEPRRR
jgi:hypothetical protein